MKPSPSNTDFGEIHDHRAGETPKFDRSHRSMSISLAVVAVDEMHTMQFGVCDVWVAHRLRAIVDRAVWNSGGGLPNTALHRANVRRASGTRRKSCAACQSWKRVAHLRARGLHPEHVWAEGEASLTGARAAEEGTLDICTVQLCARHVAKVAHGDAVLAYGGALLRSLQIARSPTPHLTHVEWQALADVVLRIQSCAKPRCISVVARLEPNEDELFVVLDEGWC